MFRVALFMIFGVVPALVAAQQDDPVLEVQQKWADALIAADLDTVSELMHPLFRLVRTYEGGSALSKAEYLALPGMKVYSASIQPLSISYHGNVATIVLDYQVDWESPAGKLPGHFKICDTMIYTDGRWQVLQRVSEVVGS